MLELHGISGKHLNTRVALLLCFAVSFRGAGWQGSLNNLPVLSAPIISLEFLRVDHHIEIHIHAHKNTTHTDAHTGLLVWYGICNTFIQYMKSLFKRLFFVTLEKQEWTVKSVLLKIGFDSSFKFLCTTFECTPTCWSTLNYHYSVLNLPALIGYELDWIYQICDVIT